MVRVGTAQEGRPQSTTFLDNWTWVYGALLPKLLPCSSMLPGLICHMGGAENQCVLSPGLWAVVQAGESSP